MGRFELEWKCSENRPFCLAQAGQRKTPNFPRRILALLVSYKWLSRYMPKLGVDMQEGETSWKKQEGDVVNEEISFLKSIADKTNMELEAEDSVFF